MPTLRSNLFLSFFFNEILSKILFYLHFLVLVLKNILQVKYCIVHGFYETKKLSNVGTTDTYRVFFF